MKNWLKTPGGLKTRRTTGCARPTRPRAGPWARRRAPFPSNALSAALSTEGRVVGLCWENENLTDLKDHLPREPHQVSWCRLHKQSELLANFKLQTHKPTLDLKGNSKGLAPGQHAGRLARGLAGKRHSSSCARSDSDHNTTTSLYLLR